MLTLTDAPMSGGANMAPMGADYLIGGWRFDPADPTLRQGVEARRLEDRAARTLAVLCERRGEIVSKAELIDEIWQGRSVSPNSVAIVIGDLRRALGDDPRAPAIIVTVGKRGYRLALDAAPSPVAGLPVRHPPRRLWSAAAGVAGGALLLAVLPAPARPSVDLVMEATRNETGQPALDPLARALSPVVADGALSLRGVRVIAPGHALDAGRHRILLRSRLIIWNGAPELAMTATDLATGTVLWSGFAAGSAGDLARNTETHLASLSRKLPG